MKEVLVSFKYTRGYANIQSAYIMSVEDWNKIKFLQQNKQTLNLMEVAGKHSEIEASADCFVLLTKDEDEIETFRKLFGRTFGIYKPFDYAMELYEELTYEEEEEDGY